MGAQKLIMDIFETAITYLASAVVWITLLAGLYQLIRSWGQRINETVADARASAHHSRRYMGTPSDKSTQHV